MRVLILGGAGMLGHKLAQRFPESFETWVTFRGRFEGYEKYGIFARGRTLDGIDGSSLESLQRAISTVRPDVVVNCIGIIKQLREADDPLVSIETNALLPHRLAVMAEDAGARLIHVSTDCVFSGRLGMYKESDVSDAEDLYGRSKFLGEVAERGALTLRTSIVGREMRSAHSLVEWFLSQRGKRIQGYTRAIYTGFPTVVFAEILRDVVLRHRDLNGVYNVAAEPISKYDLLLLLRAAYAIDVEVEPFDGVAIDRSLDGSRFNAATGYRPPGWKDMVAAMAADTTPYDQWRATCN